MPSPVSNPLAIAPSPQNQAPSHDASDVATDGQSFQSTLNQEMSSQGARGPGSKTDGKPAETGKKTEGNKDKPEADRKDEAPTTTNVQGQDAGQVPAQVDAGQAKPDTDAISSEIAATIQAARQAAGASGDSLPHGLKQQLTSRASDIDATRMAALQATGRQSSGFKSVNNDLPEQAIGKDTTASTGKMESDRLAQVLANKTGKQKTAPELPAAAKAQSKADTMVQTMPTKEQPEFGKLLKSDPAAMAAMENRSAHVQQAAAATLPTGNASVRIDSPVGSNAWNNALGQQVVLMAANGTQHAEIHLNPEDMGPIRITVSIDNSQASVAFMVRESATRDAIQSALPRLNEMMAEAGISLGQTNVQSDSSGRFAQPGQSGSQTDRPAVTGEFRTGSEPATTVPVRQIATQIGLIDRFV